MAKIKPSSVSSLRKYLALADRAQRVLDMRNDPRPWIEANLFIRTKDQSVIPFRFNAVQVDYYENRTNRDMILKGRQYGFTSESCALLFADCILRPNTVSVIVAHDTESTERIFGIVRLFWERLPQAEKKRVGKPRYSSKKEIYWPKINSHFYVGTAGSLTFGRGQTINNLHCSEGAYWPKLQEALIALSEAVPLHGRIIIESTANGMGNYFHDLWVEAKQQANTYQPRFYQWWWNPEYRLPGQPLGDLTEEERQLKEAWGLNEDQLRWRREKLRDLRDRFPQEYPENDVHCFLTSGRCCFDTAALLDAQRRIAGEPKPESILRLEAQNGKSLQVAPATLLVWRRPEEGRKYVIGVDVGEGLSHGDASVACVLDWETGEQVAELYGRIPTGQFAHRLDALGRLYQQAELGVESNNHGHTVLDALANTLNYSPLYHHHSYDQSGTNREKLGYPTNAKTKPIMTDDLAEAIAEGYLQIHSAGLVDECLTFVVTDSGSQEAQPGKYDDRVMAAAIAWQVRKRPTHEPNIRML